MNWCRYGWTWPIIPVFLEDDNMKVIGALEVKKHFLILGDKWISVVSFTDQVL
jgi:hypothetical protein